MVRRALATNLLLAVLAPAATLAALVVAPAAVLAQLGPLDTEGLGSREEPVTLTADSLEYEAQRQVYTARGNVVIEQGDRSIAADWMAFNAETGAGVASGNVRLVDGEDTLLADFLEFNVESLEGVIQGGRLDSPESRFRTSGEVIEKTGENTYRFTRGVFTTCRCPDDDDPPPWRIRAEEAEVEIGGYGTVRDATVDVKGVPVLWFPWMIYPIKTERQTGFLFPDIEIASRNGFGLGLPFFWAARDDLNLTFTPEYMTERGFKGAAKVEYVVGEASLGETVGAFAHDEKIDANSDDEPFGRNRWLAGGRHDLFLPADLRFKTDFDFASDNQVPLDYDELSASRADRYLESNAALSRGFGATGRLGATAAVWFEDDLQNPDDIDRDDVLLQRWPEVRLAGLVGGVPGIPWLRPSLDAEYALFENVEGATDTGLGFLDYGIDGVPNADERLEGPGPPGDPHGDDFAPGGDGTEGDGLFQEGEALTDDGHRAVLHPKLAAPFRLGRFAEVYPEAGWHQTLYDTDLEGAEQRGLLTGRVDVRSRLRGTFGEVAHLLEPHVGWAYVSPESQSDNPRLVPATALPQARLRALDLDAVTRDPADRIERAQRLSFGVTQRLFGAEEPDGRRWLRGDVTVLGLYDFERHDFGNVVVDGRVAPASLGHLRFHLGVDTDHGEIDEGLLDWRWYHRDGHRLGFGYRFLRDVPRVFEDFGTGDRFDDVEAEDQVDELDLHLRVALARRLTLNYRAAYSFETDLLLANEGSFEYLSACGCWAAGLEISDDRSRGFEVKVLYRLVGLGDDGAPNPGGLLDW